MFRIASRILRPLLLAALAASLLPFLGWAQEGPVVTAVRADPTTVDEGDVVAFEVDAHHPASAPLRFGWDFGDGTSLAPDPSARRTFAAYRDDGEFDVTVTVEDPSGRVDTGSVRVTVRNVAPTVRGIDRVGATLERSELTFRARASDPGDDRLTFRWDFGDGTVLGPSEGLEVARHGYEREGSYTLTLTVDDGDGGAVTYTETIVVGAGFRYSASGAVAADADGESPYLMGVPVVWDGERTRFAGDLVAATRGEAASDAGASCFVSFGSRVPSLASALRPGTAVHFTGVFPNGLAEGSYPVAVLRNELPFTIVGPLEREWAQPNTFFAHLAALRIEDDALVGPEFHGAGGSVEVRRWQEGRIELTFSANLEETLGPLDLLDVPGPLQLRPALLAQVQGSFAHAPKRSMLSGAGSLNPLAGAGYGDWYLCAPRDPLLVEEVVPDPDLATAGGAARDVPLIDFEDPEIVVRFSRPVDIGSAVEHVVLEWRRANGSFEEVPILVMGVGDDGLRLAPLDELMDGVVYRARVLGGLNGIQGRNGETLAEDETWLFETLLDLSEDRNGVTLATTQVARDAPLVADKPTETRVYLNWRERPEVHPEWQTRYATFLVEVEGGDYASQRVRVKRPDLYGPVDKKYALDSVNFHGWEPGGGSYTLTARVVQAGQVGPGRAFEGAWTAEGYGVAPALTFDYHFVRVGSWAEGVPPDARRLGHGIARLGAIFTEQTFPVPQVIARYRGDVVIDEPDGPVVELMGQEFYLSSLVTASRRDEVLVEAYAERLGATDADVVLAFLPPDVMRLSGFSYGALGHDPRVVAIQVDTALAESLAFYPSTVAHEIGHAFGLAHGTDCPRGSVQVCVDLGRSDAIEGTRIAPGGATGWNKSAWSGNAEVGRTPGTVLSLMHPENTPDAGTFITNEDYARLQATFRSLAARPGGDAWAAAVAASLRGGGALHVQEQRVLGLQVDGAIDVATGRALLLSVVPVLRVGAQSASAAAPDGTRLEARAADDALLARVAIDAEPPDPWHAPEVPAELRPFSAFLPSGVEVASLEVLDGERVLVERRASAHPPDLALPDGPLDATRDVRLTWTASDPDGDPLRFDVDYTPDGRDWRPLAIGLREASLLLSPEALPPGPEPTIRVVARDGMRATAAEIAVVLDRGPRLAATVPAEGETAPPTAAITVWTVGEVGEVGPDALTLLREDAPEGEPARVSGRLSRLPAGDGVRFVPEAPLAADARYRATFGAGVIAADGAPFVGTLVWTFSTGPGAPERAFQERNLTGRPLTSADATDPAATATELPETCAGLERSAFAPLLPAGASLVEARGDGGACRLVVTSAAAPAEVRAFVERAVLTNRLFLTANRAEGDAVRIGARSAAFTAEALLEPGPPTRLTWTLRRAE